MCPIDALTLNPRPKYFSIVRAFAGDSTMTSFPRGAVFLAAPLRGAFFLVVPVDASFVGAIGAFILNVEHSIANGSYGRQASQLG
jgi:hypothetical protein